MKPDPNSEREIEGQEPLRDAFLSLLMLHRVLFLLWVNGGGEGKTEATLACILVSFLGKIHKKEKILEDIFMWTRRYLCMFTCGQVQSSWINE